MKDIIPALGILAIPFMLGIVVGIEIVKRRPASTAQLLGLILEDQLRAVWSRRQFVGLGPQISSTVKIDGKNGRSIEIEVREAA